MEDSSGRIPAEELEAILACVADAVCVYDPAGRIVRSNAAADAILARLAVAPERPLADRLQNTPRRFVDEHGHALADADVPAARALRGETVHGALIGFVNGSRETLWLRVSAAPLLVDGHQIGAVVSLTDVTRQRLAEQALQRANARLVEADRRKDEFLGMLSHELRNPLAPIWNSLFIMEHTDAAGERARHAREVVTRQVGHLSRLVDDLLDVTRVARGKVELRRVDLDLAQLLRRTCGDYRSLMDERRLELVCDAGAPVWIQGDEMRLGQVIGNLLQNAAKFTAPGGRVECTVSVEADATDGAAGAGSMAVLRVRDSGTGIDEDLLGDIFEPFTQAAQGLARAEGGLGLGLALVKGLVELHGGTVAASSAGAGRGAEFTLRLPLLRDAGHVAGAGLSAPPERGERRVLVVDDNADAADTLAEIVTLLGHRAEVARDGPAALARIFEARPDVVLCDIGLPGMNGFDVARAVRAAGQRVRLVAVSGYAQPEDLRQAAEAGFDAHVAKPATPDRIRELIAS